MNTREVLDLLDKYYRGETDEREEAILKSYLLDGDIQPELESEREIFRFYNNDIPVPMPDKGFEERIIKGLDKNFKSLKNRQIYSYISIAATLLLIVGSYFFLARGGEPSDTYKDPELAYAETMKILYQVSSKMNDGLKELQPVVEFEKKASRSIGTITKSTDMMGRSFENYDYFQKAMIMVYSPLEVATNKK